MKASMPAPLPERWNSTRSVEFQQIRSQAVGGAREVDFFLNYSFHVLLSRDRVMYTLINVSVNTLLLTIYMIVSSLIQSKAFLQTAASLAPHMYEPHFNLSILSEKVIYYSYFTVYLLTVLTINNLIMFANVIFCPFTDRRPAEQLYRSPKV